MQEVYATRAEELEKWIVQDQQRIADLTRQLNEPDVSELARKGLNEKLADVLAKIQHHRGNLNKLNKDRESKRWF